MFDSVVLQKTDQTTDHYLAIPIDGETGVSQVSGIQVLRVSVKGDDADRAAAKQTRRGRTTSTTVCKAREKKFIINPI